MAEQINDPEHLFGSQDLTRRQFGIILATVVGGWAAWQVLGPKQANAPQPDPEQQRLIADMMATAQAGEGRAIVGDTTRDAEPSTGCNECYSRALSRG